ncbi:hypothetical protein V8C86DRAFT_2510820 [Haematococcus lacustris]
MMQQGSSVADPTPPDALQSLHPEPHTAVRLLYSNLNAGIIIGRGGSNRTMLQVATGCKLQFSRPNEFWAGTTDRVCLLTGTVSQVLDAVAAISSLLEAVDDPSGTGTSRPGSRQVRLLLPAATCGAVIGRGGDSVRWISQETSTNISLTPQDHQGGLNYHRILTITGSDTVAALRHIMTRVLESGPAQQQHAGQASTSTSTVLPPSRPTRSQLGTPYEDPPAPLLPGFTGPGHDPASNSPWQAYVPAMLPGAALPPFHMQHHMLHAGPPQIPPAQPQLQPGQLLQQAQGPGLPLAAPDLAGYAGLGAYSMYDLQQALRDSQQPRHAQAPPSAQLHGQVASMGPSSHLPSSSSQQPLHPPSTPDQTSLPHYLPPQGFVARQSWQQPGPPAQGLSRLASSSSLQAPQQQQQQPGTSSLQGLPGSAGRLGGGLLRHHSLNPLQLPLPLTQEGAGGPAQPPSRCTSFPAAFDPLGYAPAEVAFQISCSQARELMVHGLGWLQAVQRLLQVRMVVQPEEGQAGGEPQGYKVQVSGAPEAVQLAQQYLAQRYPPAQDAAPLP